VSPKKGREIMSVSKNKRKEKGLELMSVLKKGLHQKFQSKLTDLFNSARISSDLSWFIPSGRWLPPGLPIAYAYGITYIIYWILCIKITVPL